MSAERMRFILNGLDNPYVGPTVSFKNLVQVFVSNAGWEFRLAYYQLDLFFFLLGFAFKMIFMFPSVSGNRVDSPCALGPVWSLF